MIFSKIPGVAGRHAPALPADSGVSESGSKSEEGRSKFSFSTQHDNSPMVASLDRKRFGKILGRAGSRIRGVFDEETRRKPLVFAADAVRYGI